MHAAIAEQYGMLSQFLPTFSKALELPEGQTDEVSPAKFRVLIVEGSVPLARLLATGLSKESATVVVTHDRDSVMQQFEKASFDLIILDLDLPDMDELAMLRELRAKRPGLGILALGGRGRALDLVNAFDNGADDYLPKPFSLLEMMARVRALRRRSQAAPRAAETAKSRVVLHREQCSVERDGKLIGLTPREFTLLEYMMQHTGKTLSRALLTQEVWNMPAEGNTNIVDVYVKYLRDKLDGGYDIKMIRTIRGMGYMYQAEA
jgi:DNA-binding response OmpR family regulator